MLAGPRRIHAPVFKSKIALTAMQHGELAADLAQMIDVFRDQTTTSKTQLLERAALVFAAVDWGNYH